MTKVAHSSTTSTDTLPVRIPGASGHEPSFAGLPAPRQPIRHDLPALPGSDLAAIRASIDSWDHIPTAAPAPVHLTAEKLQREIVAARQHEPYLIGYGGLQADAAFGGAA